jgi:hypothetical protein
VPPVCFGRGFLLAPYSPTSGEVDFLELRIDGVLRSSAKGSSRKFANLRRLLLLRAHYHHRTGSVVDNPIGDAPLNGSPYPPVAPATHHDQIRPELLGQAYNFKVHLPILR